MKLDTCSFEISRVKIARGESSNCFDLAMVIYFCGREQMEDMGLHRVSISFCFD